MHQKTVSFYPKGSIGAENHGGLEEIIAELNQEGWRVDQIIPNYRPGGYNKNSLEVAGGLLLCTKME